MNSKDTTSKGLAPLVGVLWLFSLMFTALIGRTAAYRRAL